MTDLPPLPPPAGSSPEADPESDPTLAAGWYPDPWARAPWRWWDGSEWTAGISNAAASSVPPNADSRWGMGDIFWGILIWLGCQIVAGILAVIFVAETNEAGQIVLPTDNTALIVAGVVANALAFFGWPWLVSYRKGRRSLKADYRFAFAWVDIGWAILGFLACIVGLALIEAGFGELFPDVEPVGNTEDIVDAVDSIGSTILIFGMVSLVTAFVEEMFFRGLVLRAIEKRWGPWPAIALSSVIFGVLHYTGGGLAESLVLLVGLTWFGVVLAYMAIKLDRMAAPIGTHLMVNGVVVLAAAADAGVF